MKDKVRVKYLIERKHGLHGVSSPVFSLLWFTLAEPLQWEKKPGLSMEEGFPHVLWDTYKDWFSPCETRQLA